MGYNFCVNVTATAVFSHCKTPAHCVCVALTFRQALDGCVVVASDVFSTHFQGLLLLYRTLIHYVQGAFSAFNASVLQLAGNCDGHIRWSVCRHVIVLVRPFDSIEQATVNSV